MAEHTNDEMVAQIQRRINQEPSISDPSRISVRSEKVGGIFRKRRIIILEGSINSENEGDRAEEVTRAILGNSEAVEVENRLVVPLI
jgi:hypothetical protein